MQPFAEDLAILQPLGRDTVGILYADQVTQMTERSIGGECSANYLGN
jgi:hypothetical protein